LKCQGNFEKSAQAAAGGKACQVTQNQGALAWQSRQSKKTAAIDGSEIAQDNENAAKIDNATSCPAKTP